MSGYKVIAILILAYLLPLHLRHLPLLFTALWFCNTDVLVFGQDHIIIILKRLALKHGSLASPGNQLLLLPIKHCKMLLLSMAQIHQKEEIQPLTPLTDY